MKKVLVVDDEQDILDLTKMILEDNGYKVYCALSADNALTLLHKKKIDMVLLDIMMPETDGWDLLKIMKADGELQKIPVAMLTARVLPQDRVTGIKEGAVDYICKPFAPDELVKRVEQIFEKSRKK